MKSAKNLISVFNIIVSKNWFRGFGRQTIRYYEYYGIIFDLLKNDKQLAVNDFEPIFDRELYFTKLIFFCFCFYLRLSFSCISYNNCVVIKKSE